MKIKEKIVYKYLVFDTIFDIFYEPIDPRYITTDLSPMFNVEIKTPSSRKRNFEKKNYKRYIKIYLLNH